jgi:hypothetical protein
MCFSRVITKVKGRFTFFQQIGKVSKKMCVITLLLGVLFGKKKMQNLKNSWPRIQIYASLMEK